MLHNAVTSSLVIICCALALPALARVDEIAPLRSAGFDGSTVFSPPEFFAAYRDALGQPLTAGSARAVAAAIAALYADAG